MAYDVQGTHREVCYPTGDQQRLAQLLSELTGVPEQVASECIIRDGMEAILEDPSILEVTTALEMEVRSLRDLIRAMGGVGV